MAELVAIAAPADQEEGTEMVVGSWLKQVGESVTQNEPLLEITTDKVTVEIAAPATGVLREILKSAEQPIQAGPHARLPAIRCSHSVPASRAQISPTWVNFDSMISLSNGFMMYSLAPAPIASWM